MKKRNYNGWNITFRKNVHMYCHSLQVEKDGAELEVQCEDLAVCEGVGIWPYQLDLDEGVYTDLIEAIRDWVKDQGFEYRLYTSRDQFESNAIQ